MSIVFNCSNCHSELRVEESAAGKRARCPRCGMIHDVPADASTESAESIVPAEPEPNEPETVYQPPSSDDSFRITGYERWSMKTPDGAVYGPVDRNELDQWATEGRISAACLLQSEGQTHWQSAVTLYPDVAGMASTKPLSTSSPAYSPSSTYHSYRDQIGSGRRHPPNVRANNGTAVFVMGVLGIVFVMVPIFALIAWSMGHNERNAIHRRVASPENRWLVDAGYGLGIVGSVIGCLLFFSCCVSITN